MSLKNKKEKEVVAKVPESIDSFGDFEMINQPKYDRAVAAVGNTDDKLAILVEYDRLGGYIRYQGSKVFTGAFWDFKSKKPVENPSPRILRKQAAVVEETIEVAAVEVATKKRGPKPMTIAEADALGEEIK